VTPRALVLLSIACIAGLAASASCHAAPASGGAPSYPTRPATPVVATSSPVTTIDDRFLSVAVDAAQVVGAPFWAPLDAGAPGNQRPGPPYDFSRPVLRALAKALSPAYLRIGGTTADDVYYDLGDTPVATPPAPYQYVMTRVQWDAVNAFAEATGMRVMFTIDAGKGPRNASYAWAPDNARTLLSYTAGKGYPIALWELGNEVDVFPLAHGLSQVTPQQFAKDVAAAKALVAATTPGVLLGAPSSAYWPVIGETIPFYAAFMDAGGGPLDVVTWHYYPMQSDRCPIATRRADASLMFDPTTLDEIDRWAGQTEDAAQGKPVWLGESGNAQCGGQPGVSDTFVAGFWWLDQLGRLARRGERVVVRQTLSGSDYGLIDDATLAPRPDYWTSVLWRMLVGSRVLDVTWAQDPMLRMYAHCARSGGLDFVAGSVALVALNLDRERGVELNLDALGGDVADVYALSATTIDSTTVALDGTTLVPGTDGSLPSMVPLRTTRSGGALRATFPPASYGYVVIPGATAPGCQ